jgi:hypothetical protein
LKSVAGRFTLSYFSVLPGAIPSGVWLWRSCLSMLSYSCLVSTHTSASHIVSPPASSVQRPSQFTSSATPLGEQPSYCRWFYSRIVPGATDLLPLSIVHTVLPPLPCPAMPCHASGQQGQAGSRTVGTGQGNARCCSTSQPDRCSRLCRQKNGEWNLLFASGQKQKKKKRAPTPTEQRLRKPKPCVTLAPNRVQPNRANNVNVRHCGRRLSIRQVAILRMHVPIVAVVSASEICCPERLPAGDLAILTGAAANEAPTPSPEARSGRRRLVSGTAQCPALAAIADCYSRAHQSGPRAREATLGLGACPALTRPPPRTVSSQPSNCAYCDLQSSRCECEL